MLAAFLNVVLVGVEMKATGVGFKSLSFRLRFRSVLVCTAPSSKESSCTTC